MDNVTRWYNSTMSTITSDDVRQLAALSSLSLADAEVEHLRQDLGAILQYISELSELNTEGVAPTYQVTGLENVMREDVIVYDEADRDALLALAPKSRASQVEVPKVL